MASSSCVKFRQHQVVIDHIIGSSGSDVYFYGHVTHWSSVLERYPASNQLEVYREHVGGIAPELRLQSSTFHAMDPGG